MTVTFKLTAPFYEGLVFKIIEFLNNKDFLRNVLKFGNY